MSHQSFRLDQIHPNPFRNIDHYPIKRDKIDNLIASINQTSFWDNLVARPTEGGVEIAYGHHRMAALREVFYPDHEISVIVRDLDDATMLRMMANENQQEWGHDIGIDMETVAAVIKAEADERITLNRGPARDPGGHTTAPAIAEFLGWSANRVDAALAAISATTGDNALPRETFNGIGSEAASMIATEARRGTSHDSITQAANEVRAGTLSKRGIKTRILELEDAKKPVKQKEIVPHDIAERIYQRLRECLAEGDLPFLDAIADNKDSPSLVWKLSKKPMAGTIAKELRRLSKIADVYAAKLEGEANDSPTVQSVAPIAIATQRNA